MVILAWKQVNLAIWSENKFVLWLYMPLKWALNLLKPQVHFSNRAQLYIYSSRFNFLFLCQWHMNNIYRLHGSGLLFRPAQPQFASSWLFSSDGTELELVLKTFYAAP